MSDLFLTVLNMSATGAIVILAVLLARLALGRAPKIFSYVLWAVVLFRLLCPVRFYSSFSLIPSVQTQPAGVGQTAVQIHTGIAALNTSVNEYFAAHPYPADPGPVASPAGGSAAYLSEEITPLLEATGPDWLFIVSAVWLAGTAAMLAWSAASLLRLRLRLVGAVPLEDETRVFLADHIPSPFVLGVFRPRIYLPSGLPQEEWDYILLHERTHIRRLDHVTRALAWLALAVHWFNPLVWLAFHLAGKDMELSCDEAVLRRMGRDVRADYSSSLLRLSTGRRLPVGPLAFGSGDLQGRIKNVLNYKKPALWVMVLALAGVLAAGVALATDRGHLYIDPASVTSVSKAARHSELGYSVRRSEMLDPAEKIAYSEEEAAELVNLINSYSKHVRLMGDRGETDADHWLRIDCADGSFYLVHYWYWDTLSLEHWPGEDCYTTLITCYDAEGRAGTTWQMEDSFERVFWAWGGSTPAQTQQSGEANAAERWLDFRGQGEEMPWGDPWTEGVRELQMPEYPGVTFRWTANQVTAVTGEGELVLFGGMPVWNVYLCDLTGDGKRELCATVSYGSGMIDDHIVAYNYADLALHELWDRGVYDYSLRLEGDRLWAVERDYVASTAGGAVRRSGPLVLTETGLDILPVAGGGPALEDLPADLTLSLDTTGEEPCIRMNGTVGGVELPRGAFWYPQAVWNEHPFPGELSLVWPDFTDSIEGIVCAWWADEGRTSVTVSTQMAAMFSSLFDVGWWEFTVDLDRGTVTEMAACPMREGGVTGDTRMYPQSISDEEAVKAARVAAKLLTAAEDFYQSAIIAAPIAAPFAPVYSTETGDGSGDVLITGLGNAYLSWSFDTSPSKGLLYFAKDPTFCCPRLSGEAVEGAAHWADEGRTTLSVVMSVNDERVESGTITGFYVHFVVDLDAGAVTKKEFDSLVEGETLELTHQEMVDMARALAELMTGAEAYYRADRT